MLLAIVIGWFFGRKRTLSIVEKTIDQERQAAILALEAAVRSAEQLSNEVDQHANEIADFGNTVCNLPPNADPRVAQERLLHRIAEVLESNQKTVEELMATRVVLEQQARELDRTRWEARTDSLSGVANRQAFDEALEMLIVQHSRQQKDFALLLIDVDFFKQVNDQHGHLVGDQLITNLGKALGTHIRSRDFVGRYGGDEFAVLFSGLPAAKAFDVARRIQASIVQSDFDWVNGEELGVTLSMGLATSLKGDTGTTIIKRADEALYESKNKGRNQLTIWNEKTTQHLNNS